jgi:hypothetical protein
MTVSIDVFQKLVNFANGETDPIARREVFDLLESDPTYIDVLSDIQDMLLRHGKSWPLEVEKDVILVKSVFDEKMRRLEQYTLGVASYPQHPQKRNDAVAHARLLADLKENCVVIRQHTSKMPNGHEDKAANEALLQEIDAAIKKFEHFHPATEDRASVPQTDSLPSDTDEASRRAALSELVRAYSSAMDQAASLQRK